MEKNFPVKKILILAANPKDTARLRLDEELREIDEGLRRAKHGNRFIIQSKWAVRLRDLRRAMLDYEPQIVHFCGHGEEDGILVENDVGNAILVNPDALAGLFERFTNHVECVLLNACYSEPQAEAISQHISYVIGMSKRIQDKVAIEFAVGFYDALGVGRTVEEAFKFGCIAIQMERIPEHLTPVLKKKKPSAPSSEMQVKETPQPWGDVTADLEGSSKRLDISPKCGEWEEKDWGTLLLNLQHHNCILMLGADVAIGQTGGKARPMTEILANELAQELLEQKPDLQSWHLDRSNLAQIAQYYGMENGRTDLEARVLASYKHWQRQSNNFYRDLAALPFYLTITSTPDNMFCNALRKANKEPYVESYNLRGGLSEIITEPTAENPLLFYLYGILAKPDSLVLTETDLLDFLVAVSSNTPSLPKYILSELRSKNKSLLFLGFGFKHWYTRILLHVLEGDKKKERRSFALEQFVHKNLEEFQQTTLFFRTSDYRIHICKRELQSFVKELRERYEHRAAIKSEPSTMELPQDAPTVFLCHSKHNRENAEYLRARLREAGFNAWFDEDDLRGGDEWDRKIERAIKKEIDYFVVLQSHVMTTKLESYFNKEIRLALERQNYFRPGIRFIIPTQIDDCPLLEELEHLQSIDLSYKENVEKLISTIRRDQQKRLKGR